MEAAFGTTPEDAGPVDPPRRPLEAKGVIESKIIPCERCGDVVAMLIFAPTATDPGRFEDYARKMYPQYNRLNVPTWIIGPALGEGPLIGRPADVLKVWPTREPIQRLVPAQFNPLLDQLAEEKTRNGILCTPSVNPPRKQRLASSCVQLARVAVSFLGVSAKNIPLEPPRNRKREVFTLRLPYPCTQRPKT